MLCLLFRDSLPIRFLAQLFKQKTKQWQNNNERIDITYISSEAKKVRDELGMPYTQAKDIYELITNYEVLLYFIFRVLNLSIVLYCWLGHHTYPMLYIWKKGISKKNSIKYTL